MARSTKAGFKLLTRYSSTTNTCSVASFTVSSITKIEALFSLTTESSSGSKMMVIFVLLKSFKSKPTFL